MVNVHRASRNFPFLVGWLHFIGRVVAVKLLGFAADWMVRDAHMLVHEGNKFVFPQFTPPSF